MQTKESVKGNCSTFEEPIRLPYVAMANGIVSDPNTWLYPSASALENTGACLTTQPVSVCSVSRTAGGGSGRWGPGRPWQWVETDMYRTFVVMPDSPRHSFQLTVRRVTRWGRAELEHCGKPYTAPRRKHF